MFTPKHSTQNLSLLLASILCMSTTSAAFAAKSPAELIAMAQSSHLVDVNDQLTINNVGEQLVVSTVADANLSEGELKSKACKLAKSIFAQDNSIKAMKVVFNLGGDNNGMAYVFSASDLKALVSAANHPSLFSRQPNVQSESVARVSPIVPTDAETAEEKAPETAKAETTGVEQFINKLEKNTTKPQTQAQVEAPKNAIKAEISQDVYLTERSKLVARVQALASNGVGVRPYYDMLSKIDQRYEQADVNGARAALADLSKAVVEQEKNRAKIQEQKQQEQMTLTNRVAQTQAAALTANAQRQAQLAATAKMNKIDINTDKDVKGFLNSMPAFQGSSKEYQDQLINQLKGLVATEIGDCIPGAGVFRLERFRCAKRIHELQAQGVRVEGYKMLFNQVEDLVATKDSRRTNEIANSVRYLQSQLGLSELR